MDKLQELMKTFREDEGWNTEYPNGTHRFDAELIWIESMIKEYAEKLGFSVDRMVELMEEKRDYSWPNYYQPGNFPKIDSQHIVGVFDTFDVFHEYAKENYEGFLCPACGNVGSHPQKCDHRISKDGVCDWSAYGFFKLGTHVVILESGVAPIPIFTPVCKTV